MRDAVERLQVFRRERAWEQFHRPKELAAGISIEAAELQEHFLWRDPEESNEIISDSNRLAEISRELADVTIYVLMMANDLNLNLAAIVDEKISRNAEKYPTAETRGRFAPTSK
jgi:NTP pyrophosphatase (non-canonical NTP hydrolase)